MRKLKLHMQITVDGFVAGQNGELDWMTFNQDDRLKEFTNELVDTSDTILLGRKMTDGFIAHWENVVDTQAETPGYSLAKKMVDYHKVVFSKTLTSVTGRNTVVENGDLATAVGKLKNKSGKDIVVYGGADFVSSLIKEGLVDELNLFVNPVMINSGMRIFDSLDHRQKLTLISATAYECGITVLRYKFKQ